MSTLSDHGFDVASAEEAAREGHLDAWVDSYLRAGEWANRPFADGLQLAERWWSGPMKVDLADLVPAVGSGPEYEYDIPHDQLAEWVNQMARQLPSDLHSLPPVIAEYRHGELSLRDGNKRYWAMKQLGRQWCWTLIWFNSRAEFDTYSNR